MDKLMRRLIILAIFLVLLVIFILGYLLFIIEGF
jgi:hypothetical protein